MKPLILKGLAPTLQGAPLSVRERETLRWLVQGLCHDEVAERMGITARTVQAHTDSIRSKLNASSTNEAIFLATKGGLLDLAQLAPKEIHRRRALALARLWPVEAGVRCTAKG